MLTWSLLSLVASAAALSLPARVHVPHLAPTFCRRAHVALQTEGPDDFFQPEAWTEKGFAAVQSLPTM